MKKRLLVLIISWIVLPIFVVVSANELITIRTVTTIIVTTTNDELNDDSDCSLREAIQAANTDSIISGCAAGNGNDTILLPAGVYTLTIPGRLEDANLIGDLDITGYLTIDGEGPETTIIDGNGNDQILLDRVFHITASSHATLKDITIQNGNAGNGSNGGGIRNNGVLTLTNVILSDNYANSGGAILNVGSATIISSTIKHNTVRSSGGGIRNDAPLTITNSAIFSNTSSTGGGISNKSNVTIFNSTLSNNQTSGMGGAIYNGYPFYNGDTPTLNLSNVTITNNSANTDDDDFGDGGGILSEPDSIVNINNSILAMNFSFADSPDCSGTLNSQGYNLVQNVSNCNISGDTTGNIIGVDAKLGLLQDNGGPTFTHALLFGSPAIDAGSPIALGNGEYACKMIDQRGIIRPQNGLCDIGAFEFDGWDEPEKIYLPILLK